jgi:hypothetical protein
LCSADQLSAGDPLLPSQARDFYLAHFAEHSFIIDAPPPYTTQIFNPVHLYDVAD